MEITEEVLDIQIKIVEADIDRLKEVIKSNAFNIYQESIINEEIQRLRLFISFIEFQKDLLNDKEQAIITMDNLRNSLEKEMLFKKRVEEKYKEYVNLRELCISSQYNDGLNIIGDLKED